MIEETKIIQEVASDKNIHSNTPLLRCPIRGLLTVTALAKDGLTINEEARRIDCINYLIDRRYPKSHISVETVVLRQLGESGRNKLRCDIVVYKRPVNELNALSFERRLEYAVLVAEIKRDSSKQGSALSFQLEPAMRQLPGMKVMGVYWDDVNRLLFTKELTETDGSEKIVINKDDLANIPEYGQAYKAKPITVDTLTYPENLVGTLFGLANIMRSHGVNDEHTRYKETVKLLLARYCDEKVAFSEDNVLKLQVMKGDDPGFRKRVDDVYKVAAQRYSNAKTLFHPYDISELEDRTLKKVIEAIQGINLSSAANETMQQVFMSFVPAVFKKTLDQYFTPLTLIKAVVDMMNIGPNDKIADPAMGTADFLTSAMEYRVKKGDSDIAQRIFGVDKDQKAYDLAVINMILNRDGQSNLVCDDSIENHRLWAGQMNVVLCNPPFGARSLETRAEVLKHYDLGYVWKKDENQRWVKTEELLPAQQLGILFIERCYKMLTDGGRMGIILPEGYLCTPTYGYVREWILSHFQIMNLTELPRRIFTKSDADLRSNILVARKFKVDNLKEILTSSYPISTALVRNVGFKMGKGFSPTYARDPATGLELRDEENQRIISSDFESVKTNFQDYLKVSPANREWNGATVNHILSHPNLDMKPRRLMPKALNNLRKIAKQKHLNLHEIADVIGVTKQIGIDYELEQPVRLVEGMDIRATEGTIVPQQPCRAWEVLERKSRNVYELQYKDIVIGLVRPERRNIGLLLDDHKDIIGSPDGVAIVRVKKEFVDKYPVEWLFAALRSERSRLQLWTESGGTSYGKLTPDHIRNLMLVTPEQHEIQEIANSVRRWASGVEASFAAWQVIGDPEDRVPIINSAINGLND